MRDAQIAAQARDEIGLFRAFRPEAMIHRRRFDPAWQRRASQQQQRQTVRPA